MFDIPTWLRSKFAPAPTPEIRGTNWRQAERKLQAAGLSRQAAKRFVSEFKRNQRHSHVE